VVIRPARPDDHAAVRAVNLAAFPTAGEADLVHALRANGDALVELVAVQDEVVVGHILFTRLGLEGEDGSLAGAALAPVAVRPDLQRRGIGGALIGAGVEACRDAGAVAVVVLGDPAYYPRHGFSAQAAGRLADPFRAGDAFMAMALCEGVLDRPLRPVYAEPFGIPA